jgi:replicative DNA helicase
MTKPNVNLEEDILGLLLAVPDRYFEVAERLRPEHFKIAHCRAVFSAIVDIHRGGASLTLSLVEDRMPETADGITASVYLARLKIEAPAGVSVDELADALVDRWSREQGAVAAQVVAKIPADMTIYGEDIPDRMITAIVDAFQEQRPEAIYSADELGRTFLDTLAAPEEETPRDQFVTGFGPFDDLMGPFEAGGVTVIAGATSMGKSALAQQLAWTLAMGGIPVLFHSNEMTVRQAFERCVMQVAHVDGNRIKRRTWSAEEGDRLAEAVERLRAMPLHFDGKEKPRVAQLKVRAQRMIVQQRVRALFIDHLQFIEAPAGKRGQVKEFERLAEATSDIKAMSKALGLHVFLVSHVNRAYGEDQIKTAADIRRPRLADLHGSSTIEKDADNVIFVHRPIYHLERNEPPENAKHLETWRSDCDRWRGRVELIKAKKRGGSGFGIREIGYVAEQTRFVDADREYGGFL